MEIATRFCPLCNRETSAERCVEDLVPTISLDLANNQDPLTSGQLFSSKYKIGPLLGQGGMGRVYRATQLAIGRDVALKVLRRDKIGSRDALRRFYREATLASRLTCSQVIQVHEFGIDDETAIPYIAMELHHGATLRAVLDERGRVTVACAQTIVIAVCEALVAAQECGIVHRDLKPENLFVATSAGGEMIVKVADFGIAKVFTRDGADDLTSTGQIVGTPSYMAPEQILGQPLDHRCDLYALGCVLHELLLGEPPFPEAALARHVSEPARELPASNGAETIPEPLRDLHRRLLAKDPLQRPASGRDVINALRADEANVSAIPKAPLHLPPAEETLVAEAPAPRQRQRSRLALSAAAATGVLVIATGALWLGRDHELAAPEAAARGGAQAAASPTTAPPLEIDAAARRTPATGTTVVPGGPPPRPEPMETEARRHNPPAATTVRASARPQKRPPANTKKTGNTEANESQNSAGAIRPDPATRSETGARAQEGNAGDEEDKGRKRKPLVPW